MENVLQGAFSDNEGDGGSSHSSQEDYSNPPPDALNNASYSKGRRSRGHHKGGKDDNHNNDDDAPKSSWAFLQLATGSLLICVAAALVAAHWQEDSFEDAAVVAARQALYRAGTASHATVDALASWSMAVTAQTLEQAWPQASIPLFEAQSATWLDTTGTAQMVMTPLVVNDATRVAWQTWAATQHGIDKDIYYWDTDLDTALPVTASNPYFPVWQMAAIPNTTTLAFDLGSIPTLHAAMMQAMENGAVILSAPLTTREGDILAKVGLVTSQTTETPTDPWLVSPIRDAANNNQAVGILAMPIHWPTLLSGTTEGLELVVHNSCQESYPVTDKNDPQDNPWVATYKMVRKAIMEAQPGGKTHQDEYQVLYKGAQDLHTTYFNHLAQGATFTELLHYAGFDSTTVSQLKFQEACPTTTLTVYPSAVYLNHQMSHYAVWATIVVIAILTAGFAYFVWHVASLRFLVQELHTRAARSRQLVDALFPKEVQDRMFQTMDEQGGNSAAAAAAANTNNNDPLTKAKAFLAAKDSANNDNVPIADLFTDCTVIFADISGFTAWSACRTPSEVFQLLEAIYKEFDKCAKRRRVFKVETVGDCYVAVTGLPNPTKHHAIIMCRFAQDCLDSMAKLTQQLETVLGPDTADLKLRIGLHSGPVTAGVLRGEKGRFQLFGDTVNTASRMESNGKPGRIHISESTKELLFQSGKEKWVTLREDRIQAKGKGQLTTYWVDPTALSPGSNADSADTLSLSSEHVTSSSDGEPILLDSKAMRLVDWNVEMLARFLRKVVSRRACTPKLASGPKGSFPAKKERVIDEFIEVLPLIEYNRVEKVNGLNTEAELSPTVMKQLREYVTSVCMMYNSKNAFHNFEHASHVTMSVVKLLTRIVDKGADAPASASYGVGDDPLTQFACVFAALIHDADHPGVPNATLVKENAFIVQVYSGKSTAEQNSVDIAWELLMQDMFEELREAICATNDEKKHFRTLVVNSIMATDVMDKEWKLTRDARWKKAFESKDDNSKENLNRLATIVLEHVLQASDVAHTMQHWHVYRKWNERFFQECYAAYQAGRSATDPSTNWYQGELGFFDFYIIPLAKKLKECGVFGVSSGEYLDYALKNRQEWETRGQEVVAEMVQNLSYSKS